MGIESAKMFASQISVSSKLDDRFNPHDISLSGSSGWAPFIASSEQWIQVRKLFSVREKEISRIIINLTLV